jgi:hypothetical protein
MIYHMHKGRTARNDTTVKTADNDTKAVILFGVRRSFMAKRRITKGIALHPSTSGITSGIKICAHASQEYDSDMPITMHIITANA